MSANAGPDIVEDGIVFYYDTGNTVKSYIGEPTTNLVGTIATHYGGNVSTSYANGQYQTNAIVINGTDSSVPSGNYSRFNGTTADTNSQTYWTIQGNAVVNEANQTVSFSVYLKGNGTCHLATYNDHSGYQVGPDITLTDTWTKYSITKTIGTFTDYHWVAVRGIITSTDVFVSSAQWERKSHATQYTPTSRSVTQGLLDMARNSTVDLTDVSFDSNAQLTFDGTNDKIYNVSTIHSYLSSSAIEFVVTPTAINRRMTVGGYRHNDGYSSPTIGTVYIHESNNFRASVITATQVYVAVESTTTITANRSYHVVFNKNVSTGVLQMYINGVLESSNTFDTATYGQWVNAGSYIGSNILDFGKSNNTNSGQGWSGDYLAGKITLFKLYSKTLSTSEVQTNYNALKTRFGI